jgi:hypothetical protein
MRLCHFILLDLLLFTVTTVSALGNAIGPTAIAGLVIAVVVNSVESHPVRLLAHIGKEVLKFHPSITNPNSSVLVSGFMNGRVTGATPVHHRPRMVSPRGPVLPRVAMFKVVWAILLNTAAGLCSSVSQREAKDNAHHAAVAFTMPSVLSVGVATANGCHYQPAEPLPDKINQFCHLGCNRLALRLCHLLDG